MIPILSDLEYSKFIHNMAPNFWFVYNMTPNVLGNFRFIHNMYSLFKIDQFDAQKPPLYQSLFTIIQGDWPLENKIKYKDWPGVVAKC